MDQIASLADPEKNLVRRWHHRIEIDQKIAAMTSDLRIPSEFLSWPVQRRTAISP